MFENVIRFTAKIDDKTSSWLVENGTPIDIAEKMCLQFLQQLAQIKAQQLALNQVVEEKQEMTVEDIAEQPIEV